MPIISAFFGIVIRMFYQEHEPPHFHADHGGQQATFDFNGTLVARAARFPARSSTDPGMGATASS